MKVCIIYGGFEGSWHGKKLRQHLKIAGFEITTEAESADIIIAHSGGCLMIPQYSKANIIFLIGLPYWPDRSILRSLLIKMKAEKKNYAWIKKSLFNTLYMITKPRTWISMHKLYKNDSWPTNTDASVVAIRNEHDTFTHPVLLEDFAMKNGWETNNFKGHHDDLWSNPEPYVNLLKNTVA